MSLCAAARRIARDSASRQGLPERVEDPAVLGRIGSLMDTTKKADAPPQHIGPRKQPDDQHTFPRG